MEDWASETQTYVFSYSFLGSIVLVGGRQRMEPGRVRQLERGGRRGAPEGGARGAAGVLGAMSITADEAGCAAARSASASVCARAEPSISAAAVR